MTFQVWRASTGYIDDLQPCEGARYRQGKWFIDFATLDELMAFVQANGRCVIYEDARIQIYDDYIE